MITDRQILSCDCSVIHGGIGSDTKDRNSILRNKPTKSLFCSTDIKYSSSCLVSLETESPQ